MMNACTFWFGGSQLFHPMWMLILIHITVASVALLIQGVSLHHIKGPFAPDISFGEQGSPSNSLHANKNRKFQRYFC